MSAPAGPTLDELVAEGLDKAGQKNPSSALTTQAKTKWIEEIKNDIFALARRPLFLQVASHAVLTQGQGRYSMPEDFGRDLSLVLLDGDVSGVAQGGSITSIKLAVGSTVTEDDLIGKEILITGGIGIASLSQIVSYDATLLVAQVAPDFASAPSLGSTYLIINREYPVEEDHIANFDRTRRLGTGRPCKFYPEGDDDFGEFQLDLAPDRAYGARLRYYANVMKLDINSTWMATLYQRWRNAWIWGVTYRYLDRQDDDRAPAIERRYLNEIRKVLAAEGYGNDMNGLQVKVVDY